MIHLNNTLAESDTEISELIEKELNRQKYNIELIASENIVSKAVMEATGSILTNKYAEGYPGGRYYGGCEFVDEIERIAIERVKKIFNAGFANVQAHSGSQANFAVYGALLSPGDTILGMSLSAGGHLTHGAKVSLSGKWFNAAAYDVDSVSEVIDYGEVLRIALEVSPKIIIAGGSSYSRIIDFKKFREIADKVGAYLMVDMAHFAGMVATGLYPSPMEYADVVTSTTHKTLRGPRGGLILTNNEAIAKKINSAIFPASQGGPLMHIIAAKAVAFKEAMEDSYKDYIENVVKNSIKMAETFKKSGFRVVSGGTDTHLFMVDLSSSGITGKIAEKHLETINITLNKNSIPFDKLPPKQTSGIRIGSPCITTRGMREKEAEQISEIIITSLKNIEDEALNTKLKSDVINLCKEFPIY